MMPRILIVFVFITLFLSCSVQKFALRTSSSLFSYGLEAIYSETDLQLAEQAIASNLKLLEGFHRADPGNQKLLLMLAQGYASYSLAFLEDTQPARASLFYLRARDYGFQLLKRTPAFKDSIPQKEANFLARLPKISQKEVPALFWTAFSWAGWINLNKDEPQAVFDLNKVKAMMQRVLELNESYYFGAAHLFFGSVYGSLPKLLGGDPEKAREHFERCLELSDGKFLMAYIYYARFYALTTLDDVLYDQLLKKVLQAPDDILPGYELLTAVAKKQAQNWITKKDEIF